MVNNIVPIPGYVHLYRSMLRFYDMPSAELKEMLYLLNTANLDSYGFHHPEAHVVESGPVAFCGWLDHRYARPYRTEVQLYKSLLALKRSIDRDCIVTSQREALQMLRCVISNLEYRFYKAYNMEFEDKRTVYSEVRLPADPTGGRTQRVPDARLGVPAERIKHNEYRIESVE